MALVLQFLYFSFNPGGVNVEENVFGLDRRLIIYTNKMNLINFPPPALLPLLAFCMLNLCTRRVWQLATYVKGCKKHNF